MITIYLLYVIILYIDLVNTCLFNYNTKNIIYADIVQLSNSLNIIVNLGNHNLKYLELDMCLPYSYTTRYYYRMDTSPTEVNYGMKEIDYQNQTLEYFDLSDIISFNISKLSNQQMKLYQNKKFNFYFFPNATFLRYDSISLAFNNNQYDSHNIVNLLYNDNMISKKSFAIESYGLFSKGKLFFGGFYSKLKPYALPIPVDPHKNEWNILCDKIIVNTVKYNYNVNIVFNSKIQVMTVSKRFLDKLNKELFDNQCDYKGEKSFVCKENDLTKKIRKIMFVFGNKIVEVDINDFITIEDKLWTLNFGIVDNEGDVEEWFFGIDIIRQLTVEFDYDEKKVVFYEEKPFKQIGINGEIIECVEEKGVIKGLYMGVICINIINIIMFIIYRNFYLK